MWRHCQSQPVSVIHFFEKSNDLPINGADTGDIFLVADALGQESVTNLPGEHGGILALVVGNGVDDVGRGHLRLASANHTSLEAPRFVIPATKIVDYFSAVCYISYISIPFPFLWFLLSWNVIFFYQFSIFLKLDLFGKKTEAYLMI